MLEHYSFMLVEFYNGNEHICELYKNINDISKILGVHRSTIYKNFIQEHNYYKIVKNKTEYYIKKI